MKKKLPIKNILLFLAIVVVLFLILTFVFKSRGEPQPNLTSTTGSAPVASNLPNSNMAGSEIGKDFLALLLSIKSIKLDDSIFNDIAFTSLQDTTIDLVHDGSEGRPNPFAPIGSETVPLVVGASEEGDIQMGEEDGFYINPAAAVISQ